MLRKDILTGIVTGSASAGWLVATSVMLEDEHPLRLWSGLIQAIILLAGIVFVLWHYKTELIGKVSLRVPLKRGMMVSLITGIFLGAAVGWYTNIHDPQYAEKMIRNAEIHFRKEGKKESEIQANSEILRKSFSPSAEVNKTILGTLFIGFLLSISAGLLGGALVNRKD